MHAQHSPSGRVGCSPARAVTLDTFMRAVLKSSGVALEKVHDGTWLRVRTENSVYRLLVLEARRRRVQIVGGRFFDGPTLGTLNGSTFGGSLLKLGWIGLGMRMEIVAVDTAVLTSRVQEIRSGLEAGIVECADPAQ